MKFIFFIPLFFLLVNCSKPKTVLICGDHVCVNKSEAEQYFEKNLSIEVRIVNKNIKEEIDLVELNLNENSVSKRQISILPKKNTKEKIKTLSKEEVTAIKEKVKRKKNTKNLVKIKPLKDKKTTNTNKTFQQKEIIKNNNKIIQKTVNKGRSEIVDICNILKKCSIDEISRYLLEQGKDKKFPDITSRQ